VAVLLTSSAAVAGDFERGVEAFEKKDYDLAVTCFTKAIEASPKAPAGYFYRGLAYREKKEYDKAITDFTDAIRHDPESASCYYNRGIVYSRKREFGKALKDFDESVRLEPRNAIPYLGRGWAYDETKEYEKAAADYKRAIELDPKMSAAHNNLAWLRATCPVAKFRDGKQAVELATEACESSEWKVWFELNTLAAAYAESGDFKEAVRWQKKAIELGTDDKAFLDKARHRLKLYEKGEPYRQD
jgi:tetratricopeptide (TPR) repeat protein